MKIIVILALWLLYCFVLMTQCSDKLCLGCMGDQAATGVVEPPGDTTAADAISKRYALDFRWSDPTAFTNEGFEELKRSVLKGKTTNNFLVITGLYFEEEKAPTGFDNMGFARADQVRKLFLSDVPEDRIRPKARVMDEREGVRTGYFEGALFSWEAPEETVAQTVEELEDRVNIRFAYNSTEKEYNPEVDDYLKRLAENVKKTGRHIRLTGHTDDSGSEDYNLQLGQRRANQIRSILLGYGVPANQIEVLTRGETQPIAPNTTEEGRYENRRVEVRVLDQK